VSPPAAAGEGAALAVVFAVVLCVAPSIAAAGVIEVVGRGEARAELTMVAISPMTSARTRM